MGALLVTFGTTFLVSGILMAARNNSTAARRWMIVACTLFALTSALMIIVRVIEPGSFRHRPALGGVIVGALGIMFFGTGSIVLLVRERRHRLRGR